MEANQLPTKPGPYYWRESDGDEWELVFVREDSTVPGYELTVVFFNGAEIDFPNLGGQWAKAHNPDDVEDLAKCRDELKNIAEASPEKWEMPIDEFLTEFWQWTQNRVRHTLMNTCEPVTICRKEKE